MPTFFVENGSSLILFNLFLLIVLLPLVVLKKRQKFKNNRILKWLREYLQWNTIARTFLENGIPLSLAIFLQMREPSMSGIYLIACTIMCFISLIYAIAMTAFLFLSIYQRSNKSLELDVVRKVYGTLYEGVILQKDSKYYHMIILLRGILLVFLVSFFEAMPFVQIFPLIFWNAGLIYYLFKHVELENKKLNIIVRIKELLILIGEFCILFFYIKTGERSYAEFFGWIMVGSLALAIVIEMGYMIILQIIGIKEIWRQLVRLYKKMCSWGKQVPQNKQEEKRRALRTVAKFEKESF